MTPPNDLPLVEICAIIILVQVYCLNAARRNRLVAVRRSAHGFTYLQMHDRNTLQSRYTSLSFWSRPNYVGPQCAAPAPSRAISSAFKCDTQTFTPAPASIGIPVLRRDPGDHRIANAGDLCDLGWDRTARIFAPIPGAENLVDPPALPFILNVCDEYGGGQDAHPIFVYPWRRSVADRR